MDEISLSPVISAPLGISAERLFPIYIGFDGKVPDVIRNAEDFTVVLTCMGHDFLFENGERTTFVQIRRGVGQGMARLLKPVESIRLSAHFLFNNRFSGSAVVTLEKVPS